MNKKDNEENFGTVIINVKCSNNCVFCRINDDERRFLPLDLDKKGEVKLLRDTINILKMGIRNIDISGSEPLRYSKIVEYVKWIRPKFKRIVILDPGRRLKDYDFAEKIVSAGVDILIIPIYGSEAKYHDTVVDRKGAFDELDKAIMNLVRLKNEGYNFRFELTTMIVQQNYENIPDLYKFTIRKYGKVLDKVSIPFYEEGSISVGYETFAPSFEMVRESLLKMNEYALEEKKPTSLHYIPPCIFTREELLEMKYFNFFNVSYFYIFPKNEDYKPSNEISRKYRTQFYHKLCDKCVLKKKGLCSGVLNHYYQYNLNFNYHPIGEELYERIKDRLVYRVVNKKVKGIRGFN